MSERDELESVPSETVQQDSSDEGNYDLAAHSGGRPGQTAVKEEEESDDGINPGLCLERNFASTLVGNTFELAAAATKMQNNLLGIGNVPRSVLAATPLDLQSCNFWRDDYNAYIVTHGCQKLMNKMPTRPINIFTCFSNLNSEIPILQVCCMLTNG